MFREGGRNPIFRMKNYNIIEHHWKVLKNFEYHGKIIENHEKIIEKHCKINENTLKSTEICEHQRKSIKIIANQLTTSKIIKHHQKNSHLKTRFPVPERTN